MEDLLMNVYGDTCRKIIEDLLKQIKDYKEFGDPEDEATIKELIRIVKKPIEIYNEHHAVKGFNDYKMPTEK